MHVNTAPSWLFSLRYLWQLHGKCKAPTRNVFGPVDGAKISRFPPSVVAAKVMRSCLPSHVVTRHLPSHTRHGID